VQAVLPSLSTAHTVKWPSWHPRWHSAADTQSMSDGQREGVSTSLRQLDADATGRPLETLSEFQTVEEGFVEEACNKDPGKDSVDEELEEVDSDDDPVLQELKDELDRTTFWESNFARQHLTEETQQHQKPTRQAYVSRIALLMERMDEEQMNRFEAFRRSTLSRASMKKLVSSLINQTLSDEKVNIVLCSLGKMFVGDLIETARRIANDERHEGSLTRSHVFSAYKLLKRKNKSIKRNVGRFFSNR